MTSDSAADLRALDESRELLLLRASHELLAGVNSTLRLDQVLQRLADGAVSVLGWACAAVSYLAESDHTAASHNPEVGSLEVRGVAGTPEAVDGLAGVRTDAQEFLTAFMDAEGVGGLRRGLPLGSGETTWNHDEALHVLLPGPDGTVVGVLTVLGNPSDISSEDLTHRLLGMFAIHGGLAVHGARVHQHQSVLVRELREAMQYRDQINAAITHELKNPLTAVVGHLQRIEESDSLTSGTDKFSLAAIGRATGRMQRLVESLLELSKVSSADRDVPDAAVNLSQLVHEACDLATIEVSRNGLALDTSGVASGITASGDGAELAMVVSNLLSNALKYTPPGGRIQLSLAQEGTELVLRCADDGPGIPVTEQSLIFEEFGRASQVEARDVPGTGLGLSIVQRIVTRHGGTITVDSTVHRGATFEVRLPSRPIA